MTWAGILWRTAYGALFAVVLPVGLVVWSRAAADVVALAVPRWPAAGWVVASGGLLLLAAGAHTLIVRGGGLPLNAFPPRALVRGGVYRWVRNPMYIGFALACAGISVALGSASGLWLITPVVALGAGALVYGFERQDLRLRFGTAALAPPMLSLPLGSGLQGDGPPTTAQRAAVVLWVFVPWLIIYYAIQGMGRPADAFGTMLAFERAWPVWQWTELLYVSAYGFIPLTVLLTRTSRDLRRFAVASLLGTAVITLLWLIIPVVAVNRAFEPANVAGRLLAWEQAHSRGVAAFPAFHVLWTLLAADAWTGRARSTGRPMWAGVGWTWAGLITVSCITTGMHTVLEVAAALCLYWPISRYEASWARLRTMTERLANSWKEWRVGPVRVINHAVFAAAAAGVGILVAGSAAGPLQVPGVVWTGLCILFGSALWAQAVEGSPRLLRPFGWYGGILGGVVGAVTARLAGGSITSILAAFVVAAPWIQILGRLRCLVQGCCHGGPAPAAIGIRYAHRRSRVTQLADFAGVPIHATPLYSILSNVVIGLLLLRLRWIGAPETFLVGAYLILGGVTRFVEEAYRGEPQTPVVGRLRLYQWIAVASVIAGAICTALPSAAAAPPFVAPNGALLLSALLLALLTGVLMGVDLPRSNRRFSRLAAAD